MLENAAYQRPFIFSVLLHAGLLAFLILNLHDYVSYHTAENQNTPVIQAVAISESQLKNQSNRAQTAQKAAQQAELKRAQAVEQKQIASAAKEEQQRQQEQAAQLLAERRQLQAEQTKIKELLAPVKQLAPPVPTKPIAKPTDQVIQKPAAAMPHDLTKKTLPKKQTPKQQTLDPKLKQAMEQELQKQLAQESVEQELAAATHSADTELSHSSAAQLQGEVDKYKALIIQAISQHWLVPEDVRQDLSCELLIRVTAQGEVLSVEIVRSSGDVALDRSARAAVLKAAPLPVPSGAEVFDKFRELRLTVRPENVL